MGEQGWKWRCRAKSVVTVLQNYRADLSGIEDENPQKLELELTHLINTLLVHEPSRFAFSALGGRA